MGQAGYQGPRLAEDPLHDAIRQTAEILGWEMAHFRKARTGKGWRTPVAGGLGKGWPDMILVRKRDRRIIFAELKGDGGKVSPDQERVLDLLSLVALEIHNRSNDGEWLMRVTVWTADDWRSGVVEGMLR